MTEKASSARRRSRLRSAAYSPIGLAAIGLVACGLMACEGSGDPPSAGSGGTTDTEAANSGPVILGRGSISTELPEFAVSFTPDGSTIYFNRTDEERSRLTIMVSSLEADGTWSTAEPASFSGESFDVDPFVTPDGTRLYFSSNRITTPGDTVRDFNTWFVDLDEGDATEARLLPPPFNTEATEVFVSATRDGVLYFSSNRDGVSRTYRAEETTAGPSINLVPIEMNLAGGVGNPLVSPDERFLLFVAETPEGAGAADIHVSYRTDGEWTPAEMLRGGVNSPFTDFAPALSPDGEYLYFTSERPGIAAGVEDGVRPPGDIYRVSLSDAGIR